MRYVCVVCLFGWLVSLVGWLGGWVVGWLGGLVVGWLVVVGWRVVGWLLLVVVGCCWLLLVVVGCCWLLLVVVGCCVFRFVVSVVRVLGSMVCVFRVVSVVCGLVSRRHLSRRPSSRLCCLVAVALCLCVLCVMRFWARTPAWNNKIGLVAYFVGLFATGHSCQGD